MTPADARHTERMLACISSMRSQSISLVHGVDSLLLLCNALDAVEQSWADEFTSQLATLESAGLASANQIADMGSAFTEVVVGALDALEGMIRGRSPAGISRRE